MLIVRERLMGTRARKGFSQQELAERLNVALRTVQSWELGESQPRPKALRDLSEALGVSIDYLIGEDTAATSRKPEQEEKFPEGSNVSLAASFTKMVPVVSWAAAGAGGNYYDLAEYLEEEVPTDVSGENAYALIVEGNSMEPIYRAGDRIIINPNDEPRNGDVVVARLEETGQVFFKLYHMNGRDIIQLTSYNPAYPPLEYPRTAFRFIQPVHASLRYTRSRR